MYKLKKEHRKQTSKTISRRYREKVKMGFQKGHAGFGGGFKKGHIPWNKLKRTTRKCPICSKIYDIPIKKSVGAGYRKYCSRECDNKSRLGKKPWNKNKKTGIVPKTAFKKRQTPWNKGLTKEDPRIRKMVETRRKTDNFKHTEKSKLKIRKARAKQKFPFNNTKIEVILQKRLTRAKIKYTTQKYSLPGTPDIFIKPNICIFCDGDYWHNRPGTQEKDEIKNKELRKQNYIVLRFWEHEIHNNIEECINKIIKKMKYEKQKRNNL